MKIPAISAIRLTAFKNSAPMPLQCAQENTACQNENAEINCKQKTDNKKTAGFIAAGIAIAAGIIYAAKKSRLPIEVKDAMRRADEFVQNINTKVKDTIKLYNNGGKDANGNIVARIKENLSSPSSKIMEEIPEDTSICLKRSYFKNGILETIEEFLEDNTKNITVMKEGKLSVYQEGMQKYGSGDLRVAKEAYFKNDKPEIYTEGVEFSSGNNGGRWKQAMQLRLSEKGKPTEYLEGIEYTKEKGHKILKRFLNGKLKTNVVI